ncbi:hypothetical protein CRYUN_Cryun36dG0090400 [Craigia yunnanensis]
MFNRRGKDISVFHRLSYIVLNNSSSKPSLFLRVRCISKTCSGPSQSFAVSYLEEKLGFSPESALAASKYLHFKTPDKPDSVIAFLEKQGFSKTQIKKIIAILPRLLSSNAEKTFLPKLEFFQSKGVSSPELTKILLCTPDILYRSLEKTIIPSFNQLSNLLQSDSKAMKAIKLYPLLLSYQLDASLLPNVPDLNIISMFNYHPRSFVVNPDQFKEIVKEVKEMGFNPLLRKFLHAVIVFRKVRRRSLTFTRSGVGLK